MREATDTADLVVLDTAALQRVGGGCGSCPYEMHPPTALDAAAMQQHVNVTAGGLDNVGRCPPFNPVI